jgi:hypothetical protein
MAFYLTVTKGADEGKTFRIDEGRCSLGRSPGNTIVLRDETVAWEHALVREDGGRLVLQNLSAAGTRVRGNRVTTEVRLGSTTEVQLSEQCAVRVQQRLEGGPRRITALTVALLVVLGLIVVGAVTAVVVVQTAPPATPPMTEAHWRQGYNRLEARLAEWSARGWFPAEAVVEFREAWRLEQAQNLPAANEKWRQLYSLLLSMPMPRAASDDRTIAQAAGTTNKALGVIMGWDRRTSSADFEWNTDEAYADALVWFVWYRVRHTSQGT